MAKNYNSEYYVLFTESTCNSSYPAIETRGSYEEIIFTNYPIMPSRPLRFCVSVGEETELSRLSEIGELSDAHKIGTSLVVSNKVKEVVALFEIEGISWHRSVIENQYGDRNEQYWYMHTFDHLICLDMESAEYSKRALENGGDQHYKKVKRYSLKQDVLDAIPEEKRLIIHLGDNLLRRPLLFHQKLVTGLVKSSAKGFRFYPVSDYFGGMEFWSTKELAVEGVGAVDLSSKNELL